MLERDTGCEHHHFVLGGPCLWVMVQMGMCGRSVLHHEPTFLCSSLVKSEATWLHYEECRFKGQRHFCHMDIGGTTLGAWNMQIKINILASFLHFRPSCIFTWGPLYERLTNLITEDVLTVCECWLVPDPFHQRCVQKYILCLYVFSVFSQYARRRGGRTAAECV